MTAFPVTQLYIDGVLRDAEGGRTYANIAPATGKIAGSAADGSSADMDAAIAAARRAFDDSDWPTNKALRLKCLRAFQEQLRVHSESYRARIATETGAAAMVMARPGYELPVDFMTWTIDLADSYDYERELPVSSAMGVPTRRLVVREAAGVVAAITPWNMPMQINLAKLTPALAAGCTVVLKPAPETPWSAAILGEAAQAAGFPPGVLNIVTSSNKVGLGDQLVRDPRVDVVSFTGSTATGRKVMAAAAEGLKRVFLELGGKSANIILEDAPFPEALYSGLVVCYHAGQGCAIPTRMLIPRSRYDEALAILKAAFEHLPYGDPNAPEQMLSPVISETQRDRVLDYIRIGCAEGARLVTGGEADPVNGGYYIRPTLFADVRNEMRIAQEEIFGPVLAVIPFDDDEDAIRIANDSIYGLSGAIQSADSARAMRIARRIRTGALNINSANYFNADAPFGGYKQSGIGREMGVEGFEEYLQVKVIGVEA
jgi:aldehyde dehydrogenase (NAD+)